MRRADRVSSFVILLVGAFYLFEAGKLPLWKGTTFGSGLFPLILGVALLTVASTSFVKASLFSEDARGLRASFLPPRAGLANVSWALGSLAVYTVVLERLGFVLSTFLFLSVLFIRLDPQKKASAVVTASLVVAVCYVFFVLVFRMQLPRGLLG